MTFNGFDASAVSEIDQSTVHIDGTLYPTIQWGYGTQAMKKVGGFDYLGGWFIAEDAVTDPAAFEGAGWEHTEWTHQDGSSTAGFWRREIEVAVINIRQRWEVQSDDGKRIAFAWKDFDAAQEIGRPSGRLHALVIVKGIEDEGQFVLTLKGMGGMAFFNSRGDSAMSQLARTIMVYANKKSDEAARKNGRSTGLRWPWRAFWLPVGAARTDKGEPVFIKAGNADNAKHVVLPVAMGLPSKPADVTDDVLNKHYVGNELLAVVNAYYTDAEENWTHAWDNIEPGVQPYRNGRLPDAETIAEEGI